MLAMLDVEESMLDIATEERRELRETPRSARPATACDDLERYPAVETVDGPGLPGLPRRGARSGSRCAQCLECGEVGCCDSSVGQHATKHFHETTHPVMESAEPGEDWRWCYVHHNDGLNGIAQRCIDIRIGNER